MKAHVHTKVVKEKVVTVEMSVKEAEQLLDGPNALNGDGRWSLAVALDGALVADEASEADDVPF